MPLWSTASRISADWKRVWGQDPGASGRFKGRRRLPAAPTVRRAGSGQACTREIRPDLLQPGRVLAPPQAHVPVLDAPEEQVVEAGGLQPSSVACGRVRLQAPARPGIAAGPSGRVPGLGLGLD